MDVQPDQLLGLAKERFDLQDYYGCIHFLRNVMETGPAYADAHNLMGLALQLVGQPGQALASFDQALELNPRYHEAHVHRGIVLAELGRADEAETAFEAAGDSSGAERNGLSGHHAAKLANQHAALGDAYAEAGAMAAAVEQYHVALQLGPTFHDLRHRMARLMLESGRSLEAREELETLVAAQPYATEARAALGLACYMSGDRQDAQRIWRALQRIVPDDPKVRAYLAMLERANEPD